MDRYDERPTHVWIRGFWVHVRWLTALHPAYWKEIEKEVVTWQRYRADERARKRAAKIEQPASYA